MIQELPAFPCPHCHERTFTKRRVPNDAPVSAGTVLTHLHLCPSCGENYLSTVHVAPDRTRTETWDYYLERATPLRRVRRYDPAGTYALAERPQLFLIGGELVTETAWRSALSTAREAPSPLLDEEPLSEPARAALVERWLAWWTRTARPRLPAIPAPYVVGFDAAERRAA